jgi:hypothetical protein
VKSIKHTLLVILAAIGLINCKLQSISVAGTYADKYYKDTLEIHGDSSYLFTEKLNSGYVGWTTGTWVIKKKKIYFKSSSKIMVGYSLQLSKDSSNNNFQITLLLGDSKKPVHMEAAYITKNMVPVSSKYYSITDNKLKINTSVFDSIIISAKKIAPIIFSKQIKYPFAYIARIYPAERLYELNSNPFKIKKNELLDLSKKEKIAHILKKIPEK